MLDILRPILNDRCRTFGDGLTADVSPMRRTFGERLMVDVAPVSCCPLANHVMTAGGLEIADLHVRVIVSPAVAC